MPNKTYVIRWEIYVLISNKSEVNYNTSTNFYLKSNNKAM